MPFRNDPNGGGTNADGSKSAKYCSYCYVSGDFARPKITATEMQQLVKTKLQGLGIFNRLFAGFFVSSIPNLERWKNIG